jgi:hypothetical protein
MRCSKTVTPKKIEANRRNGKRSTGPRTQRGKLKAKFNAVTLGLFSKHVVIPVCDGDGSQKEFERLLDALQQEFHPVGTFEEWLVLEIAECMWRLRRATRCESGSLRELAIRCDPRNDNELTSGSWGDRDEMDRVILGLATEIGTLTEAEEQLRNFGTLAEATYAQVLPLVEEERQVQIQSAMNTKSVETQFDDRLFSSCITDRKESLESMYRAFTRVERDRSDARFDHHALPPAEDMDKILRYEERMHRQLDWALQRLLESQERRKTSQSPPASPLLVTGESAKRSQ